MYFSKLTATIAAVFAFQAVTLVQGAPSCFKEDTDNAVYDHHHYVQVGEYEAVKMIEVLDKPCLKICVPMAISCAPGWSSKKLGEGCYTCCKD